jgi:hypothetical protein
LDRAKVFIFVVFDKSIFFDYFQTQPGLPDFCWGAPAHSGFLYHRYAVDSANIAFAPGTRHHSSNFKQTSRVCPSAKPLSSFAKQPREKT